ncbi:hypothetical protein LEP1GSC170_1398 [Leptospira interrogans serovar Bataviae str. HAI135]|nr:hypothetical protein LEP1GSC170_1398 [Leptospira interrogans serovar Bataviae str. HAI135]
MNLFRFPCFYVWPKISSFVCEGSGLNLNALTNSEVLSDFFLCL